MSDSANDKARGERIAKWLARAGVASRRDAEKLVAEGRVRLNNEQVTHPATFVTADDIVVVNGTLVEAPERTRLWRYHKPDGLVTTHRDPEGRPTVFDKLPPALPRVVSVGRLDLTSEGLLLLTNDGALARRLELPATGWIRRYRVRVHGRPDERALERLAGGVIVDGVRYGPIEAGLDAVKGDNAWVTVALREGRNREVRRVMQFLGLPVTRLIRVAYGPFQLGTLPRGAVEEVPARVLRDQVPRDDAPGNDTTARSLREAASGRSALQKASARSSHHNASARASLHKAPARSPRDDATALAPHEEASPGDQTPHEAVQARSPREEAPARPPRTRPPRQGMPARPPREV
jgi:23S rRNA pseudouridine2605 synthase